MIGNLFYLCPSCFTEDSLTQQRESILCLHCKKSFPIENNQISFKNKNYSIAQFYELVRTSLPLRVNPTSGSFRTSRKARLRQGIRKLKFRGRNNLQSEIESPVDVDRGTLVIEDKLLIFKGNNKNWIFPKEKITGYTTNSKYFEFKILGSPFFQIFFEEESPLKYEDLFTTWFHNDNQVEHILEHQPRITNEIPKEPSILLYNRDIQNWNARERFSPMELLLHLCIGLPIVTFLKRYAKLTLVNVHLVPENGPFILLMNHESYLDPIIISTVLPRRIGFFTKSTSFADKVLQPIFRAYRSLPNRRYEIDPQVVRQALGIIRKGNCIGIFPEGERTWSGELLPFKYNTIKFLMSVQVPVVVVTIKGAYTVLPRWTHKINPGRIQIEVQRGFSLIPGRWKIEDLKAELESYFMEI
jgi:1-acyl-sn-glycerol-3-phosphate acyltransferase